MELTPYQLRVLTHTALGEALPHDPAGQAAVISVILNRAASGQFGSSDPAAIALQRNQFSAWNSQGNGGNDNVRIPTTDPRYQAVEAIVRQVADGTIPDPTNGATYYYAPGAMQPAGRTPSWARGMYQTANVGGQLFFSPHPTPPGNIPDAPTIGNDTGNPLPSFQSFLGQMVPLPAPPPLTPASMAPTTFNGRLPPAAMNGVDRLSFAGPTPVPTDFTTDPVGGFDPRLAGMVAPQRSTMDPMGAGPGSFSALQSMLGPSMPPLPIPRPAPPTAAPPVPMQRPAALSAPPATNAAPSASVGLVRLPSSGQMIKPGVYPSPSNPGSTVTITDDGKGNAVIKNNAPGIVNIAKMGPGTVAGGYVGQAIGNAASGAAASIQDKASQAKDAIVSGAANLGSTVGNFGSNVLSGLGGIFGSKPPSVPAPPASYTQAPAYPGDLSSGGHAASASVINPKYTAWQAQYGNQGGLSTGTSQNTVSAKFDGNDLAVPRPVVPPAPPKYIPAPVIPLPSIPASIGAVPPMPMGMPSWLAPVMPQSAVFANNPIAQAVAKSNYGGAAQFLSGSQNNYSYLQPAANKMGVPASSLHAALMAQQNKAQGGPVGSPSNFGSSYFEAAF